MTDLERKLVASEKSIGGPERSKTKDGIDAEIAASFVAQTVNLKVKWALLEMRSKLDQEFFDSTVESWKQIDKLHAEQQISGPTVAWASLELRKYRDRYTASSNAAFKSL